MVSLMSTWWQEVWHGMRDEFSDVPDADHFTRLVLRLVVAAAFGALLGGERERAGKAAGLRTHMLVAVGASFFVLVPQMAGMALADLSRVIQGVATGIGFLGAGAILKPSSEKPNSEGMIQGLTTAAGLWLAGAGGMAAGLGQEASVVLGGLLAFTILFVFQRVDRWIQPRRERVAGDSNPSSGQGDVT